MASERAFETAINFLGHDFQSCSERWGARKLISHDEVPETADGLRMLAANGNWSGVISLAERLEKEAMEKERMQFLTAKNGDLVGLSERIALLQARMPYIVVRATAYFKTERIPVAKEMIDALGDIEGEDFLHPTTRENIAPFSLRFISSLIPFYMNNSKEAQCRLSFLLSGCEKKAGETAVLESTSRKWGQRIKRLQRALIYLYYSNGQYALAIRLFQKMLDWDTVMTAHMGTYLEGWSHAKRMRYVLQLQQFACLCLQCGNDILSQEVFDGISTIAHTTCPRYFSSEDMGQGKNNEVHPSERIEAHLYLRMMDMNEGFRLVFLGKFSEAAEKFRSIAMDTSSRLVSSEDCAPWTQDAEGDSTMTLLGDVVSMQIKANAQTSHCTCLPYCGSIGKNFEILMTDISNTLEIYLRSNPSVLVHSGAFLSNLARVYTLRGDCSAKLELLADLLEVFRCDAASLPCLEKMV